MRMTEKQMCIACWYWIYYKIESGDFDIAVAMKQQYFVNRHCYYGLVHNCLFCTYCATCDECPVSADHGTSCFYYRQVLNYVKGMMNEETRQNALAGCLKIIEELVKFPIDGKEVDIRRNKNGVV